MRPSKLRNEKQKQNNYLTKAELESELDLQVQQKKQESLAQKLENEEQILNHYKNYNIGKIQN